jgi:hypothetical protein
MKAAPITGALLVVATFIGTGCANSRALLKVPREDLAAVRLKEEVRTSAKPRYLTIGGRTAREIGQGTHGLLGLTIGAIGMGASQAGGSAMVAAVRDACDEGQMLRAAIERLLTRHGLGSDSSGPSEMTLRLIEFGLLEEQPGYFVPFAYASASVNNAQGKDIWSATAYSQAIKPRGRQEYTSRQESYLEDFQTVCEDLARQLIEGPIRPIKRL